MVWEETSNGSKSCKIWGSSLADADSFRQVRAIVDPACRYVVPSAPGKDLLAITSYDLYICYHNVKRV